MLSWDHLASWLLRVTSVVQILDVPRRDGVTDGKRIDPRCAGVTRPLTTPKHPIAMVSYKLILTNARFDIPSYPRNLLFVSCPRRVPRRPALRRRTTSGYMTLYNMDPVAWSMSSSPIVRLRIASIT